jgi:hypothetical protein
VACEFDDTEVVERPGIEAEAEADWPQEIRRSWPAFIAGVSRTWLDLIEEAVTTMGNVDGGELDAILDLYMKAEERVNVLWQQCGRHAFLHHLNAVFGYIPVLLDSNQVPQLLARF